MIKTRYLLAVILMVLAMLALAGCTTSFEEWSGNMSNETGRHVKPYNVNEPGDDSQAIQPAAWVRAITMNRSAIGRTVSGFWLTFMPNLPGLERHSVPRALGQAVRVFFLKELDKV